MVKTEAAEAEIHSLLVCSMGQAPEKLDPTISHNATQIH